MTRRASPLPLEAQVTCPYEHVKPGAIAVNAEDYAEDMRALANARAGTSVEIDAVRREAANARADLVTSLQQDHQVQIAGLTAAFREQQQVLVEQFKSVLSSLGAREDYARSCEARIGAEITNRQNDLLRVEGFYQRIAEADKRDAALYKADRDGDRKARFDELSAKLNADLWKKGIETAPMLVLPFLPDDKAKLLESAVSRLSAGPKFPAAPGPGPGGPPALCMRLIETLWQIRDPAIVDLLAGMLHSIGSLPDTRVQALMSAIAAEAPAEAAAIAAEISRVKTNYEARFASQSAAQSVQPSQPQVRVNGSCEPIASIASPPVVPENG